MSTVLGRATLQQFGIEDVYRKSNSIYPSDDDF